MKKILFSFLAVFCLLITVNNCFAYSVTSPTGSEIYEIPEEYVTYCCYGRNASDEQVLVSKQKGIFKLEWVSGWSCYAFKFYPEGSINSSKFDVIYINAYNNQTIVYDQSQYHGGNLIISECNTDIVYGSTLNPDGNEVEGQVFFQPPAQVEKGILTQVLEKEIQNNPKLVLEQIAVILIPILVAVVCFLGFRKAWKILRTSLNNA